MGINWIARPRFRLNLGKIAAVGAIAIVSTTAFVPHSAAEIHTQATAKECLSEDPGVAPPPFEEVWRESSTGINMICGQEETIGVRHINVAHPILSPDKFANCTQDIVVYGRYVGPGTAPDSSQWNYDYVPGKTAILSHENATGRVITSFTMHDGSQSNNWTACADAR